MSTFPHRALVLVAAVALVDADGRVLIAKRPEGKPMAGMWEFPGGKVEAGERPEPALIREIKEELGIDVTEACLAPLTFASNGTKRSRASNSSHSSTTLHAVRTTYSEGSPRAVNMTARNSRPCGWRPITSRAVRRKY